MRTMLTERTFAGGETAARSQRFPALRHASRHLGAHDRGVRSYASNRGAVLHSIQAPLVSYRRAARKHGITVEAIHSIILRSHAVQSAHRCASAEDPTKIRRLRFIALPVASKTGACTFPQHSRRPRVLDRRHSREKRPARNAHGNALCPQAFAQASHRARDPALQHAAVSVHAAVALKASISPGESPIR